MMQQRTIFAAALALVGASLFADGLIIKAKAVLAQILLERAWSQTLTQGVVTKPWRSADTWPVAKLEVQRLAASTIVLNGASGQAMAFGPGLMTAGAKPGDPGVAVISAHRDTHFRFLKYIEIGDEVTLTDAHGKTWQFIISDTQIVDADAFSLVVEADTPQLALVTCWPFDAIRQGSDRFVAIGDLKADTIRADILADRI